MLELKRLPTRFQGLSKSAPSALGRLMNRQSARAFDKWMAFAAERMQLQRYAGRFTKTGLVGETSTAGIAPRITPLGGAAQDL